MKAVINLSVWVFILIFFNAGITFAQLNSIPENNEVKVELPEILVQSMEQYKNLQSYLDSTYIEIHMLSASIDTRIKNPISFSFERPNSFRYESTMEKNMGGETKLFCNGKKITSYLGMWKQYTEEDVSLEINREIIQTIQSIVARNFVMNDEPLELLKKGLKEAKEIGEEEIDGVQTGIVELLQTANSIGTDLISGNEGDRMLIPVSLWIAKDDFMVRKMTHELDMELIIKNLPEDQQAQIGNTYKGVKIIFTETHRDIEINPDFPDSEFDFIAPEGSMLVDDFTPSGVSANNSDSKLEGKPAPNFTLKDIDGKTVSLDDFRGKVVLVDFWATWCGPCLRAMPHMQSLAEIFKNKDLEILGINSWERARDRVKPVLKENNITYRILLDVDNEVVGRYGVRGIPTFFIIDKKGLIRYNYVGMPSNKEIIQKNIEELLAEF